MHCVRGHIRYKSPVSSLSSRKGENSVWGEARGPRVLREKTLDPYWKGLISKLLENMKPQLWSEEGQSKRGVGQSHLDLPGLGVVVWPPRKSPPGTDLQQLTWLCFPAHPVFCRFATKKPDSAPLSQEESTPVTLASISSAAVPAIESPEIYLSDFVK